MLVEQRDGVTVFGRDLLRLRPGEFTRLAVRLRVSTVVATDEDLPRLRFLGSDPEWGVHQRVGPFLVFSATTPRPLPQRLDRDRYFVFLAQPEGGVGLDRDRVVAALARAESRGPLPTRQGRSAFSRWRCRGRRVWRSPSTTGPGWRSGRARW